ncbi:MAG: signal peptidase I [Candidatus Omnitrophota bacterium]|nr:signal peptidase I [Candidatus Omnitrophota bacterium]
MAKTKAKEPLLALFLSVILVGLGQIYSARVLRGILFLVIRVLLIAAGLYFILSPAVKINFYLYLLLLASLAFQIFVIVDSYFCAKAYNKANRLKREISPIKRISLIVAIVLVVSIFNPSHAVPLYIKANIVQAIKVPDMAMAPTLVRGDTIFVDKSVYKKANPARADVVIFKKPDKFGNTYIARVMGLPGETVELREGRVLINGAALHEPQVISKIYYDNRGTKGQEGSLIKVPDGSYFILGDNSVSSKDSRFFGCIAKGSIIGRAYKVFLPLDRSGAIK